jgi:iron-sulfur cluster repair protein YtfE (RIC family)
MGLMAVLEKDHERTVMTRLKDEFTRHMAEEERELFPRLRKKFPPSAARPERGGSKSGA